MRKIIVISLIAILIFAFSACFDSEVTSIELSPDSISTVTGVNITINVTGYDADGNEVTDDELNELGLVWKYETASNSFVVSNGVLTPIAPGTGTVWVECENSNIKSQKSEVLVEETKEAEFINDGLEYEYLNVLRDGSPKPDDFLSLTDYYELSDEERTMYDIRDLSFSGHLVKVSGLKDKAVEDKVNELIFDFYIKNVNGVPENEGFRELITDNYVEVHGNHEASQRRYITNEVYVHPTGTYNNIASFWAEMVKHYDNVSGRASSENSSVVPYVIPVIYTDTINIDLNTGEVIELGDLFREGYDWKAYVTEKAQYYVSDRIAEAKEAGRTINYTFEITDDVDFYLHPGGIQVYFNLECGGEMGIGGNTIVEGVARLPYTDDMVVWTKYYNPEVDLYETPVIVITEESTEEEIFDFWKKAHIIRSAFANMDVSYSDAISADDMNYYKVTDKRFATYEDFISTFEPYFSERYISEFIETDSRFVFNDAGKTYADGGAMGSNIYDGSSSFGEISFNDNVATLVIYSDILDDNREVVDYKKTQYTLVLENGIWKFDTFELTNFQF